VSRGEGIFSVRGDDSAFTRIYRTAVDGFYRHGGPLRLGLRIRLYAALLAADMTIIEFNSARAAARDFETIDINFPLLTDSFISGPAAGGLEPGGGAPGAGSDTNSLPFGP